MSGNFFVSSTSSSICVWIVGLIFRVDVGVGLHGHLRGLHPELDGGAPDSTMTPEDIGALTVCSWAAADNSPDLPT